MKNKKAKEKYCMRRACVQLDILQILGGSVRLAAEGWGSSFQTLVAIIMSARTRDEVTIEVAKRLFVAYPDAYQLSAAGVHRVARIIRPVNFFRNKTRHIIACAKEIVARYGGILPEKMSVDELITLSGVGRKTANVFLAEMGESAIGVDTHVAHIAYVLGWTKHRVPGKIEQDLKLLFPRKQWRRVNSVCVQFGKKYTSRKEKAALLSFIGSVY